MTAPSSTPAPPVTVALIGGDRFCAGCGYNLVGQSVVREPHYALLMARCPECGHAALLSEYPALGRWAGRFAGALAALWLLALLVLLAITTIATLGVSILAGEMIANPVESSAHAEWNAWNGARPAGLGAPELLVPAHRVGAPTPATAADVEAWWAERGGVAGLLEAMGIRTSIFVEIAAWGFLPAGMILAPLGVIWASAMAGVRRSRLILVWAAISAVPLSIHLAIWSGRFDGGVWWDPVWQAIHAPIERQVMMPATIAVAALGLLVMLGAMLVGRPVARLVLVWLLPPGLRRSLAHLWTCDGLTPR